MTINARKKGHVYERKFCEMLRFFGWEACTSRSENLKLDALGVDIITDMDFNYQLKAVERLTQSYWDILGKMPKDKTRVVVHKRNNKGAIVVMSLEDFQELHINKGIE